VTQYDELDHQLCICVSKSAVSRTESAMSIKLLGIIFGKEMLILLDSGSSATFLSSKLAAPMPGRYELITLVKVQVANG
jgi:hypothetical protein